MWTIFMGLCPRFTAGENSFDKITRRLRIDPAMVFCRLGYAYASRYP